MLEVWEWFRRQGRKAELLEKVEWMEEEGASEVRVS